MNHACKNTCSGWDDGYKQGAKDLEKLKLENAAFREVLNEYVLNCFEINGTIYQVGSKARIVLDKYPVNQEGGVDE